MTLYNLGYGILYGRKNVRFDPRYQIDPMENSGAGVGGVASEKGGVAAKSASASSTDALAANPAALESAHTSSSSAAAAEGERTEVVNQSSSAPDGGERELGDGRGNGIGSREAEAGGVAAAGTAAAAAFATKSPGSDSVHNYDGGSEDGFSSAPSERTARHTIGEDGDGGGLVGGSRGGSSSGDHQERLRGSDDGHESDRWRGPVVQQPHFVSLFSGPFYYPCLLCC
jgi:hypothetical protein